MNDRHEAPLSFLKWLSGPDIGLGNVGVAVLLCSCEEVSTRNSGEPQVSGESPTATWAYPRLPASPFSPSVTLSLSGFGDAKAMGGCPQGTEGAKVRCSEGCFYQL